jgi:response regulator RpfG family c-di-GMP phosphodiesterase
MTEGNTTSKQADRKTVMICDDEPDLLNMYKMTLDRLYDVIIVDSGKECIDRYIAEKHTGKKIHVLLLDYKLGDMLGDIVACKISELNGVKTLLISAYDLDEKMVNDLIERNCIVGTIRKPISLPKMLQQIQAIS